MLLKETGEDGLLQRIISGHNGQSNGILVGIGDDAAVISPDENRVFLLSCHMIVEGSHFLRHLSTPYQVGVKAITKSVADIEAMGGSSRHLLVGLSMPPETNVKFVEELYRGINEAGDKCGLVIVGGDISDCNGPITISVTITGDVRENQVIKRKGARPGDLIVVTGTLGAAAAGLHIILKQPVLEDGPWIQEAIKKQLEPEPPAGKGSILADTGAVTAMTDISDGLVSNLNKICQVSDVGAKLYLDRIPISKAACRVADKLGHNALEWALYGGEDFEMVATINPPCLEKAIAAANSCGFDIQVIGEITSDLEMQGQEKDGTEVILNRHGYDHFK